MEASTFQEGRVGGERRSLECSFQEQVTRSGKQRCVSLVVVARRAHDLVQDVGVVLVQSGLASKESVCVNSRSSESERASGQADDSK